MKSILKSCILRPMFAHDYHTAEFNSQLVSQLDIYHSQTPVCCGSMHIVFRQTVSKPALWNNAGQKSLSNYLWWWLLRKIVCLSLF